MTQGLDMPTRATITENMVSCTDTGRCNDVCMNTQICGAGYRSQSADANAQSKAQVGFETAFLRGEVYKERMQKDVRLI